MVGRGGVREGAGRPAGSLNRRTVEMAGALAQGLSPLEYMLGILRDENASEERRTWAAEKAAPFFHPKPAPMPRLVRLSLPKVDTAEGVKAAFARLVEATAAGELAPTEAQSFVAIIEAQRRAIETADVLERVEALEQATAGSGK